MVVCLSFCTDVPFRLLRLHTTALLVLGRGPFFRFYDFNIKGKSEDARNAGHLVQFCGFKLADRTRAGIGLPSDWHSRCPDSCMLEKIKTFAPWDRTDSTSLTYFLRNAGSFELSQENLLSVLI